jgi:periplasmic protein CpxP/Spy
MNAARLSALAPLALVAALAAAPVVQAQDAPPGPAPMAGKGWDPAQMQARMEARRAARTKALHDALNIQPGQESAFTAYADAMKPSRGPGGPGGWRGGPDGKMAQDRAAMAAMTTPQRLDFMAQKMDQRMAQMKADFAKRDAATKALYAQLSPDQKRTMDALPMLRDGGGHGWGRGGRGPGGPGGPGRG